MGKRGEGRFWMQMASETRSVREASAEFPEVAGLLTALLLVHLEEKGSPGEKEKSDREDAHPGGEIAAKPQGAGPETGAADPDRG